MRSVAGAVRNQVFPLLVTPFASPNSLRKFKFMCVRICMESHSRLARFFPLPGGLGRFGSRQGIYAADMACIRVGVAHDGVAGFVWGLVTLADKPFARSATRGAVPISVDHAQCVPLLEERPGCRQGLASWRPVVLPSARIILRLRLPSAPVTRVVFTVVLDAVLLNALDLLELSVDERGLALVALPLLAADPLEVFTFFATCELFVF